MIEDIVWVMLRISDTKVISYISVFDIESIFFFSIRTFICACRV